MPATEQIIIRFDKKGDKDLIAAIEKLDKVTVSLILNQGKLHAKYTALNPKVLQLGANLKKHGKTLEDIGLSQKLYNQALRNNKNALSIVTAAAKRYEAAQRGVNKITLLGVRNNRLLSNSFATARSQLLLFSFGAMLVERAVVSMVKAYGRQEAANQKLRAGLANVQGTLPGVTQRLVDYSSALQKTTAFGDEMITTGMTQLTTFGLNEAAIKALTPQVLNVARAIQQTSGNVGDLNSLFIAFGKSTSTAVSALTRYGVVLTDTEKAQLGSMDANTRAIEIAKILDKQYGGLAEAYAKTTLGMLESAAAARSDAAEALGEVLAPAILAMSKLLKVMFEAMSPERIKRFGAALAVASLAALHFSGNLMKAVKAIKAFQIAQIKTGWGAIAAGIGFAAFAAMEYFDAFDDGNDTLTDTEKRHQKLKQAMEDDLEAQEKLREAQEKGAESLQQKLDILNATSEAEKMRIQLGHEASKIEKHLIDLIVEKEESLKREKEAIKKAEKAAKERIKTIKAEAKAFKEMFDTITGLTFELADAELALGVATGKVTKGQAKDVQLLLDFQEKLIGKFGDRVKVSGDMNDLINTLTVSQKDLSEQDQVAFEIMLDLFNEQLKLNHVDSESVKILKEKIKLLKEQHTAFSGLSSLMEGLGGALDISAFEFDAENQAEALEQGLNARSSFYSQLGEMSTEFISQELEKKENAIRAEGQRELEQLRNSRRYKRMSDTQKQKEEDKITAATNKKLRANFNNQQNLAYAQIAIDTSRAVMGIWAEVPKFDFGISAGALTAMVIALGSAQAALVGQQSAPTFARGGDFIVPPGYPNDTFPMRVESGERVRITPKSEVGGASPSSSTININFSGNVLSQDFIENEAIPQIKEAVRRGADLGVA